MTEWVSTKTAMELLGVGSTTIKRWANEGTLSSMRTAGGHRRFNYAQLRRLSDQETDAQWDVQDTFEWIDCLVSHNDVPGIARRIENSRDKFRDWYELADTLGQVVIRLGDFWDRDDCGVAQEHLVSHRLQRAIESATDNIALPPAAPACILATLAGERHTLGLSLAQMCLRAAGYETIWVGADTPSVALSNLIEELKPRLVALSASSWMTDDATLAKSYRQVAGACRNVGGDLLVGGTGSWPAALGAGYRCESFADLRLALSIIE